MDTAVNTTLLQFQVEPSGTLEWSKIKDDFNIVLNRYIGELSILKCLPTGVPGGFLVLFTGRRSCLLTVKAFPEGMISVMIEYFKRDGDSLLLNFREVGELARDIAVVFKCSKYETFPPFRRGPFRYTSTTDERLIEHDIDKVVFSEKSPYQQITIAHSVSFGNMLFLDGFINYSSSDGIYTKTLLQQGKENYHGKEILILGGGDGAALRELLTENPKLVLMVDIDEVVIRACRTHMREVHGGFLDSMKGLNYEIIIADCKQYFQQLIKECKKFDFVIGDLTDIPVSGDQTKALSFIRDTINLSLKVMKPTAKYLCHCDGTAATKTSFENILHTLDEQVDFSSSEVHVPSFLEFWQFYQIWRKNA